MGITPPLQKLWTHRIDVHLQSLRKAISMIIKVLLVPKPYSKEEYVPFTMLFGDSYKKWQTQLCEFMYRYYKPDPSIGWRYDYVTGKALKAWYCKDKWIGWGGLKWCPEEDFQGELNREGCQSNEPDNPNPRQYSKMIFLPMSVEKIEKALKDY